MPTSYRASAPGSIMLLGEHAVLHGKQALACAVKHRISVTLSPRTDRSIQFHSILGEYVSDLDTIAEDERFRFLVAATKQLQSHIPSGFDLQINSSFSSQVGLGSSAAVTAAMIATVYAWLGKKPSPDALFAQAIKVIRTVQGQASGTDLAASIFGGVIAYRMKPLAIRRLHNTPDLVLVYSGHKEPTPQVIRIVEEARKAQPRLFNDLFGLMDQSTREAVEAVESRNWSRLGSILNMNQGLMDAMGVNTPALADIVFKLRDTPGILGTKISGSGLGDCAVGLGSAPLTDFPYETIPIQVSPEGVRVE